jgi:hypothetical protein
MFCYQAVSTLVRLIFVRDLRFTNWTISSVSGLILPQDPEIEMIVVIFDIRTVFEQPEQGNDGIQDFVVCRYGDGRLGRSRDGTPLSAKLPPAKPT